MWWAKRELGIRPGIAAEDEAAVWRKLDFVAELLSDGRDHLCGDALSGAADLTFAALSASVVVPPVYGVPLPQPGPHAVTHRGRSSSACGNHPAGSYALALYDRR